jgi:hypothetical protein
VSRLPQLAASWGNEATYPSPGSLWLKRKGANSMPPGSPPLLAICRGVGPRLYAGVPACGLIATPTNRDRRRRREPEAGGNARRHMSELGNAPICVRIFRDCSRDLKGQVQPAIEAPAVHALRHTSAPSCGVGLRVRLGGRIPFRGTHRRLPPTPARWCRYRSAFQ